MPNGGPEVGRVESPRDVWAFLLMAIVAVAAAWISFSALTGLARLAHIWPPQLLPLAIDAYAVASTRLWLRGGPTVKRWAMVNSFGAIAISIAGNAAYHGLAADGVKHIPWQLAASVAAVAPLTLWLVVHMHSLATSGDRTVAPVLDPVTAPVLAQDQSRREPSPPSLAPAGAGAPNGSTADRIRTYLRTSGPDTTVADLADRFGTTPRYARKVRDQVLAESNGHQLAGVGS